MRELGSSDKGTDGAEDAQGIKPHDPAQRRALGRLNAKQELLDAIVAGLPPSDREDLSGAYTRAGRLLEGRLHKSFKGDLDTDPHSHVPTPGGGEEARTLFDLSTTTTPRPFAPKPSHTKDL